MRRLAAPGSFGRQAVPIETAAASIAPVVDRVVDRAAARWMPARAVAPAEVAPVGNDPAAIGLAAAIAPEETHPAAVNPRATAAGTVLGLAKAVLVLAVDSRPAVDFDPAVEFDPVADSAERDPTRFPKLDQAAGMALHGRPAIRFRTVRWLALLLL